VRENKSRVEVVDSDKIRQDERAKRKELLELKNKEEEEKLRQSIAAKKKRGNKHDKTEPEDGKMIY